MKGASHHLAPWNTQSYSHFSSMMLTSIEISRNFMMVFFFSVQQNFNMMMMDIFGKPTNSDQFFNPGNSGLEEEEGAVEESSLLDTVAKLPVSLKTAASNFGKEKYLDVNKCN